MCYCMHALAVLHTQLLAVYTSTVDLLYESRSSKYLIKCLWCHAAAVPACADAALSTRSYLQLCNAIREASTSLRSLI